MAVDATKTKEIRFFLQDVEQIVATDDVTPTTTLNGYIRNTLHLTGTKYLCFEGGCGSCVVVVKGKNPVTQQDEWKAVNSCLVAVLSCHGWQVYTIEGIGGPLTSYHPIQDALSKFNGTQCGFCSPGMVMNMYAMYESGKLTMEQVEDSFGGNLCRCTGYRSILTAFKSLCKDASPDMLGTYPDIEDLNTCKKKCSSANKECVGKCVENFKQPFYTQLGDSKWYKMTDLKSLLDALKELTNSTATTYMLVAGNTAKGIFADYQAPFDVYFDVSAIPELKINEIRNNNLVLGANNSLTDAMDIFNKISQDNPSFSYLKKLGDHIDLVANPPVRNIGSIAGNLMMKHDHNDFPSDIFLILETIGAVLTIVDGASGAETQISPMELVKYNMKYKVIEYITFPPLDQHSKYESYKIMKRAQNTHAMVNAGFLFNFNSADNTVSSARIVIGNINAEFIHATDAETFLAGKDLFNNDTLQSVYEILAKELNPTTIPPDPSPELRKELAIALFYKTVLSIAPQDKLSPKHKSGGVKLLRPLSTGLADYQTHESLYPLTQAIPKIESQAQTSGRAEYINDMPDLPLQLFSAFVMSEAKPNSTIKSIDTTKALAMPDVVGFFGKDDIPGDNNFTPLSLFNTKEEIFCSGKILFYNQPIGIIVANNFWAAEQAANAVEVTYEEPTDLPLLTARAILAAGRTDKITEYRTVLPKRKGNDVKTVITGTFDIYQQYHFHMEGQCCNVVPNEDGLDVFPSSQWMDLIQTAISGTLNIPNNKINVNVRRCGGAFGAKISRNSLISCAAALAAWKLRRPVKLAMPLVANMNVIGKRWPLSSDYEIGVNEKGVIQYLDSKHYSSSGCCHTNETGLGEMIDLFMANYDSDTFTIETNLAATDTYANTWTRAPGSTEGLAVIEAIMEHVAYSLNLDPLDVRIANITTKEPELLKYIEDIKQWADIDNRKKEISTFNSENRWKKRGICIVPMAYKFGVGGPFSAMVTIYHGDGSVAISHAGIEIGQGINTKAAQVCAYKFGIPLEKIAVIPSKNFISANATSTGGSVTSEAICYGVIQACDILLARLAPYRSKTKDGSWEETVTKAFGDFQNLSAIGNYGPKNPDVSGYTIYGVCASEVILDILTGQYIVSRVDLIEDIGQTLSPDVDIGQLEGAFIMGMGYHTTEQIVYDQNGKLLTNSTWTYTPPGAKDIPVDFRIKFPKDNPNPVGVLKTKAIAEPPLCLTISVPLAIRNAVASARSDADTASPKWYPIDGATTVENVFLNSLNTHAQYIL